MKRQRGFTLLEVMIAAAIMAVGIVGALELFSGSLNLAGNADRQSQATVLARALIDEEMWRDVLENNERSGTEGQFSWSVVTQTVDRELIGRAERESGNLRDPFAMGLWLIEAEVRWNSPSGEKSLLLQTARLGEIPQ